MPSDLVEQIRQKKAFVNAAERKISELQSEIESTKAELEEILAVLHEPARTSDVFRQTDGLMAVLERASTPIALSSVQMAEDVLRESGRAMHIDAILARIKQKFNADVRKDTIVGNLSRYIKVRKTFTRTAPSYFGLVEFDGKGQSLLVEVADRITTS